MSLSIDHNDIYNECHSLLLPIQIGRATSSLDLLFILYQSIFWLSIYLCYALLTRLAFNTLLKACLRVKSSTPSFQLKLVPRWMRSMNLADGWMWSMNLAPGMHIGRLRIIQIPLVILYICNSWPSISWVSAGPVSLGADKRATRQERLGETHKQRDRALC